MPRERKWLAALLVFSFCGLGLFGQIQHVDDVEMPETATQGPGNLTPYFWVGAQAVGSLGYNLETGAFGIRDLGSSDTWASFNFAMVDSRYADPKEYLAGDGVDTWTGYLALRNFSFRFNSWESDPEANTPIWKAEVRGLGFRFGMFSQAGAYFKSPVTSITGGKQVLYFNDPDVSATDFNTTHNPYTTTTYQGSGLAYLGYVMPDFLSAYLTFSTEGHVGSGNREDADGIAGVLDFEFNPLGSTRSQNSPIGLKVKANLIGGFGFDENPFGFGVKVEPSVYLGPDSVLTPVLGFDATIPDGGAFQWAVGGGLTLRMSPVEWAGNTWGDVPNNSFFNSTYETERYQKYAYAQVYAAYSANDNLDLAVKFEEPDGSAGFDRNLGAMAEFRLNNLGAEDLGWSAVARLSYDLADHKIVPYLRTYVNDGGVFKLRTGVQAAFFPHAGFELAYTSRNLNASSDWDGAANRPDLGRVEIIMALKTDSGIIQPPRRMADWNYTN